MTRLVKELRNNETKALPSLIKMIEDLSDRCVTNNPTRDIHTHYLTRISRTPEPAETVKSGRQQDFVKLFDDMKVSLRQFGADSHAQIDLNNRIAKLQQTNLVISASNNASELEVRRLSHQLHATQNELSNYKTQLEAKAQELKDIQALPKEDPRLVAKIEELEALISSLHGKLKSATQELTTLQEENVNLQETTRDFENRTSRLEKEKQEIRATFTMEKQKDAELAERNKTEKDAWHETTVKNLRQQNEDKAAELRNTVETLHRVQVELEDAKRSPKPAAMEHIIKLYTFANQLYAKFCTSKTTELNDIQSLGVAVQRGTAEIEQTKRGIDMVKMAQTALTHSLKKYETRDATLLNTHPRILSNPKAPSSRSKEVLNSNVEDEATVSKQNKTPARAKANRVLEKKKNPAQSSVPNCVAAKVILDSQSQTEAQSDALEDEKLFENPRTKTSPCRALSQAAPSPQALQKTPALRPFASMDSESAVSSTSDMTCFSDLGFDDVTLEFMDSNDVIVKAEVLSHNKYPSTADQSTQLRPRDQHSLFEHNAIAVSNQFLDPELSGHATLTSAKPVPANRTSTARQPLHRQPSTSLKSALKPFSVITQSNPSTSAELRSQTTQINPVKAKSFNPTRFSAQGTNDLRAASKNDPSAYNRVASSSKVGATNNTDLITNDRAQIQPKAHSQVSPVPNATRRNSSFTGFNGSRKRPAEIQATPLTSKAPRLSKPLQIQAETKPRLSISTAGSRFGKRR
jgi:hypothetical protein